MRVLAITKIFPNGLEPLSSPFNRQQFAELAKLCDLTVLEAVPYVPLASLARKLGLRARAARLSALPKQEKVGGIETHYMRQLYLPRIGLAAALRLYLASLQPYRELALAHDVILGTWAYPDGCAATLFAEALGKPCAVKVHGSDVNVLGEREAARKHMSRVLPKADAVISVARPLSSRLEELGVSRSRIHLVRNGVDTKLFHPRDRRACRAELGISEDGPLIVFSGRLEPQKGLPELLAAFERVLLQRPDARLALLGAGVMQQAVSEMRARLDGALIANGARPLSEVALWMSAADVITLPSHAEGTPNVVLEALASARPVVATHVGGIPDCLADPESGILVPPHDEVTLANALLEALDRPWNPDAILRSSPGTWAESAAKLYDVLQTLRRPSDRERGQPYPAAHASRRGERDEPRPSTQSPPFQCAASGSEILARPLR
jgi:teichuronic acid biosynthesis glycosyltransferase TuaC